MINLYTDTSFLTESNRRFIFPLMLDVFYTSNCEATKKYTLVDRIDLSDIAVLPLDISYLYAKREHAFVQKFILEAKKKNKIIWVYSAGDLGMTLDFNYDLLYVFRLGGNDSKMNSNNLILPAFIPDPYFSIFKNKFKPINKTEKPTIGFVGHASAGFKKVLSEFYIYAKYNLERKFKLIYSDYFSLSLSGIKRFHLLKKLSDSDGLTTHFIFRKKYRAGAKQGHDKNRTTQEYFQNIHDNAYTFCFRGGGNFSVRFYETLAMGRIPILVNTDCRLPLPNLINWENHCLIIDFDKKSNMIEKIITFHENCSDNRFIEMQENNRLLQLNYLSRTSYFLKIYDVFNQKLVSND